MRILAPFSLWSTDFLGVGGLGREAVGKTLVITGLLCVSVLGIKRGNEDLQSKCANYYMCIHMGYSS